MLTGVCNMKQTLITKSLQRLNGTDDEQLDGKLLLNIFSDFKQICSIRNSPSPEDIESAIQKYSKILENYLEFIQKTEPKQNVFKVLKTLIDVFRKAWLVPTYGHEMTQSFCKTLRECGALDFILKNIQYIEDPLNELQFLSVQLLEPCLTRENLCHVLVYGIEKVIMVACSYCTTIGIDTEYARVGTGILEQLFKHSESTCSDIVKLGGLDAILYECCKNDVETLRHCAMALANLSLYGGCENQKIMVKQKVPMWLFPLAFHNDDNIKYYACLAIAVLSANREIEAEVLKSETLDLVEPFLISHDPLVFAKSNFVHVHGQGKYWLHRLLPVLSSNSEKARSIVAFHFCMKAQIKKEKGRITLFREIGAIEPLTMVASSPNAIASKFAAQTLRLIGEAIPYKLSQQVPLWSVVDVSEWVKQIGYPNYHENFLKANVNGDLLLLLKKDDLRDVVGITYGICRKRFWRELNNLKKMADYSSKDVGNLNSFMKLIRPDYCIYTYVMLTGGINGESIKALTEDQLIGCGITNSIHRQKIIKSAKLWNVDENLNNPLHFFISYRRSGGSHIASLLKIYLQQRGYRVFIDVERLKAGKFDNNILNSIKQAKNFVLILTRKALDRCIKDFDGTDWIRKEIVAAMSAKCNVISIVDQFKWPAEEELPKDIRAIYNVPEIQWAHDYQVACVDKLEKYMQR